MRAMDAGDDRHVQQPMTGGYTLSLYEKAMPDDLPLFEKLLAARALGYDGLELCVDLNAERQARLEWGRAERKELAAFLIDHGLRIPTFSLSALRGCPLGDPREGGAARGMRLLRQGFALCCAIGAQVMLINGYDVYDIPSTPDTVALFAENIHKAALIAASYGIVLGIENAEKQFMDTISKAARCVREVNSPYLRVYGDVGNAFNGAGGHEANALADIESGRGITAAMHLKDTNVGEYRMTRYGEGHVNFAKAVPLCMDMGVRLYTAELFMHAGSDWRAEAQRVGLFLRRFFETTEGE